jgi:hypothetical protein
MTRKAKLPLINFGNGQTPSFNDVKRLVDAANKAIQLCYNDLNQLKKDAFDSSYVYNGEGVKSLPQSLQDQINLLASGGVPLTGTPSDQFTINTDGNGIKIDAVGSSLSATRCFTFPNYDGLVLVGRASATTDNYVSLTASVTTGNALAITASSLTSGAGFYLYSNSSSTTGRNLGFIHDDNAASLADALCIRSDSSTSTTKILNLVGTSTSSVFNVSVTGAITSGVLANGGHSFSFPSLTTGLGHVITGDAVTTGSLFRVVTNAGSTLTSDFVTLFYSQNASAGDHAVLVVAKDAVTPKGIARFVQGANTPFIIHATGGHVSTIPIRLPDGAISAPALTRSAETNTGIYWNGSEFRTTHAGTVGIVVDSAACYHAGSTSSTVPRYARVGDQNTGLGFSGLNTLALIAGGSNISTINASGILLNVSGSAATPALRINDSDTGLYLKTTNTLSISSGGSLALDLTSFPMSYGGNSGGFGVDTRWKISTTSDLVSLNYYYGALVETYNTLTSSFIPTLKVFLNGIICGANVLPWDDSTYSLGSSTKLWTAVWADDNTINTSDIRFKNNINNLNSETCLNIINALNPINYEKNGKDHKYLGFGAQEVQGVLYPHFGKTKAVYKPEDESKEKWAVSYSELIAPIVGAIQELSKQVAELKGECNERGSD